MATDPRGDGRLWRIAGCIVVLSASVLVLKVAASRSAMAGGWGASLSVDPQVELKSALNDIAHTPSDPPNAAQVAKMIAVAKRAPLLPEPFVVAGLAMADARRGRDAGELLQAARARDPHKPVVRFLLGDYYRRTGQDGLALRELASLMKVQPQQQVAMLPYFAQLATQPQHRAALGAMARSDPEFGRTLLVAAADAGAPTSFILSVGDRLPLDPANLVWQGRLVQRAISAGDIVVADRLAKRFARSDYRPLINARFDDKRWPSPFNWTLTQSIEGVSEVVASDRLSLLSYGRNPLIMASQVLVVPPQRYRLSWRFEGAASAGAAFHWKLTCLSDNAPVAGASLDTSSMAFEVSDACHALTLDLLADASTDGSRHSGTLSNLSLDVLK